MEDQITRINKMEAALDASAEAVRDLSAAFERYEAVADRYSDLEEYYGSEEWRSDFKADEAGLLPADLKRGVLSEDSVYDLITEHDDLMRKLKKLGKKKTVDEAIEELTLVLTYLTRFSESNRYGVPFNELSWKGYDHGTLDLLDEKGHIYLPVRAKYMYMTEDGRARAREILAELNIEDHTMNERYEFRDIRPGEADRAAEIEQIVFPPNEAVPEEAVREQVAIAPELFLVAVDKATGDIAGFLNGIATDEMIFRDEFFTDKTLHDPDGKNVMLLGLDVLPAYRKQGLARELVYTYCRREQAKGRKMLMLTCLPRLVKMYSKMGFRDNGISQSTWGGETWHEMSILLNL